MRWRSSEEYQRGPCKNIASNGMMHLPTRPTRVKEKWVDDYLEELAFDVANSQEKLTKHSISTVNRMGDRKTSKLKTLPFVRVH